MKTQRFVIILAFVTTVVSGFSAQAQRRWSPQAKGTAIGAGVGGAAGAIINKRNRVVGGLIGVGAGAAGGYAIGKSIDNRQKTNARMAAAEREAAEARREAALARQEAAAATERATVASNKADSRVVITQKAVVPATTGSTASVGPFTAAAFSAQALTNPSANGNTLFLVNNSFGDPNTAYPSSEIRWKSW